MSGLEIFLSFVCLMLLIFLILAILALRKKDEQMPDGSLTVDFLDDEAPVKLQLYLGLNELAVRRRASLVVEVKDGIGTTFTSSEMEP